METSAIPRLTLAGAQELAAAGTLRGFFWISDEDYHHPQCPGVSSTRLKALLRSPAHYRAGVEDPEETAAMIFGRQVHEMIFQPDRFVELYAKAAENPHDWNKERKAYQEWKAKRAAELGGKMELAPETWDTIDGIVDAVWEKKRAAQLLEDAHYELACFSTDPDTGLAVKVKTDVFGGWYIADLKTCKDARPEVFVHDAKRFLYHLSAAFYLDVVNRELEYLDAEPADSFIWIAAEKKRPHGVWCHNATPPMLDAGRILYKRALKTLQECTTSNEWPCYPDEITDLEFAPHQLKELTQ